MSAPASPGPAKQRDPAASDLLREALADLREHPALPASPLTQKATAQGLAVRADRYHRLEHGSARWRPGVVDEASRLLGGVVRPLLYRLALGARPNPPDNAATRDAGWHRQIVEDWPTPALLVENAGIVTYLNGHARNWFPPLRVGSPLAAAVLCDPAARELLGDWPSWAALAVADLRYGAARRLPGRSGRLVSWAIRRSLADAEAARIWKDTAGSYRVDAAEPLRLASGPGCGRRVRLLVSEPGTYPGRVIRFIEEPAPATAGDADVVDG